ncbi:hypothetical protein COLO4_24513 [Corchorus olitorius]|uniref:Uncharacterized protein n=1 Tax=Corchorus olitorius TaxID=93759 RepID=A0A1R3I9D9_9ROSI|nr:hypothetical protein COLO4_24513 [Corchorus olitorius]
MEQFKKDQQAIIVAIIYDGVYAAHICFENDLGDSRRTCPMGSHGGIY